MREFFRGWRIKLGVVTLGLATVLTGAWIRSLYLEEDAWVFGGCILIGHFAGVMDVSQTNKPRYTKPYGWRSHPPIMPFKRPYWPSFECTERYIYLRVPHWNVVAPLGILSAYLLLWKPRPKPKAKRNA
jgi:hypothetical protein